MTCSRSCEIFALLYFLRFGESLGTANNKRKDLMMNSGKSRISTQNELREMKLQRGLSKTILCKAKRENNRPRKLQRSINYYRRTSFVGVPLLFGHFAADFACISDSDDIWQLCKYEHSPRLSDIIRIRYTVKISCKMPKQERHSNKENPPITVYLSL